jgi:4-amino-4-deoxy-L-arabinose transferase-like glycosyltransferase
MSMKCTRASMVVAACTLAGLLWRAEGLLRRSFWLDEVLTVWRAGKPTINEVLIGLESVPFPPLYYMMLWGWTQIWGMNELAVRALPMIIGVATVPATYLVWAGLIGRRNALWAVALLGTSAFHVFYSQDAKMYAAVWLLATLSSGAFLRSIAGGPHQSAWLIAYGVSNAALLQTSYVGVVPLAIQSLHGLLVLPRIRPFAGRLAMTAALSCLPSLAWLPTTIRTVTHRTGISWIPPVSGGRMSSELCRTFGCYVLGYRSMPNPPGDLFGSFFSRIYGPACGLAGAAILVYLVRLGSRRRDVRAEETPAPWASDAGSYLVLWAALPAVASFLFSITVYPLWGPPRYLMASGPAIILLLGSALGSLKRQVPAYLIGATLISANAAMILFEKTHVTTYPYRQMVGISAALARRSPEFRAGLSHASDPLSVVHLDNGLMSDLNEMCVDYEIGKINAESRPDDLQLDRLEHAVERGLAFFVIDIRPIELSEAAARERLERRIASRGADDAREPGRYEVRSITSAEVRADGPLPNPLVAHVAQLWACLPAATGPPQTSPAPDGSGPPPRRTTSGSPGARSRATEGSRIRRQTVMPISSTVP